MALSKAPVSSEIIGQRAAELKTFSDSKLKDNETKRKAEDLLLRKKSRKKKRSKKKPRLNDAVRQSL